MKLIAEKRSQDRLEKSLSTRVKFSRYSGFFDAITHNVSLTGARIELNLPVGDLVNELLSKKPITCELVIRLVDANKAITVSAAIIWTKRLSDPIDNHIICGLSFESLDSDQASFLDSYLLKKQEPVKEGIEFYTLLVGGKEIDTGSYEYFPYTDKAIIDFKRSFKSILNLKKGIDTPDNSKYVFAKYAVCADDTNKKAIDAAHQASLEFRKSSIEIRKKILNDIRNLLVIHKQKIIELLVIEGHSVKLAEWEFLGMERAYHQETLDFYASEIIKEMRCGDEQIFLMRKADGVVCLSPPKNASCSNSLLAAFALLAGNTIIVKPPYKAPVSTIYLWKNVINEALRINGAPAGCVNIVVGNSKRIMDEWLDSPLVNDIIYFGESESGLEIGKQAYLKGKKAILELSGNDMFFIWKDADIDKAIASLLDTFLGSTQICMVPKNAVIHSDIYDKFLGRFKERVRELKTGLPTDPDTFLTPVIRAADFYSFLDDALGKGANLVCGGKRIDYEGKESDKGAYFQPTLVEILDWKLAQNMKVVQEENFFPLLPLIKVSGADDQEIFSNMLSFVNNNQYGLRTSVWVKDDIFSQKFIQEISNTGLLKINCRHVAFSPYTSTHGGTRKTGGPYGEMNYIWQKTSHLQGIVFKK